MSAQPAGAPVADRMIAGSTAAAQWAQIHAVSPQVVVTMQRYLQRLAAFQAPTSVDVAENALRIFAGWMICAGLDKARRLRSQVKADLGPRDPRLRVFGIAPLGKRKPYGKPRSLSSMPRRAEQ